MVNLISDFGLRGGSRFYRDFTWEKYDKDFWDVSRGQRDISPVFYRGQLYWAL